MRNTTTPFSNFLDTRESNEKLLAWLFTLLEPPKHISTLAWVNSDLRLSPKNCAKPGRYSTDFSPYLDEIYEAIDDPSVQIIVTQKPAQFTWTTLIAGVMGKRIACQDPGGIIVMFPREQDGKDFIEEKFRPMVEVTPTVRQHLDLRRGVKNGDTWRRKDFGAGWFKLVGSNSPSDVKSSSAPLTIVEEPSDANRNVKGQGNSLKQLWERTKSFPGAKMIFGGTPGIKGFCEVSDAYEQSDQRQFWVRCHVCHESHVPSYENLKCEDERYETAYYECPHCHIHWSDNERIRNVLISRNLKREGYPGVGWIAQKEFRGIAGFKGNELLSSLPGSRHAEQMRKWLEAKRKLAEGDDTDMIVFVTSSMAEAYEYASGLPDADKLRDRAEGYEEFTVPWGGLLLTAGVDVQHDRLAVVIRAWGRGEESWLVWWGEIYGQTMLLEAPDPATRQPILQGAWVDLDALLTRQFRHASGTALRISAVSIDASDGQTSDAVYPYVRRRLSRGYMAIKGASHDADGKKEIFTVPGQSVDADNRNSKAHKYGLRPFMVGTSRAKDLILGADEKAGRIKLAGSGPGRMHVYADVRPDYFEQLTAEVKIPSKKHRGRKVWECKSGVRNEALDCEVYALHAARSLKTHLWKEERWAALEARLKQSGLWEVEEIPALEAAENPRQEPAPNEAEKAPANNPAPIRKPLNNHRKPTSRPIRRP